MIENERELFAAIEQFLIAEGDTKQAAMRARELVTWAQVDLQREARVKARRDGLRVVDAVPPGAAGTRRSRRKKGMTGGLRVIDGDGRVS
jgi:hypothetical protein